MTSSSNPAPKAPSVRSVVKSDRAQLDHTLGPAFADDPVWMWLLGKDRIDARRTGMACSALVMPHVADNVSTISDDGNSVAIWAPPNKYKTKFTQLLPYLVPALRGIGLGAIPRLGPMSVLEKMHPDEPHYYLAVLATHPDYQGKGLGSAVMAPTKALADEQGVGCYLESSKEENISLYERHGFEVTGTYDIDKGNGPRLWFMWRDPQVPEL